MARETPSWYSVSPLSVSGHINGRMTPIFARSSQMTLIFNTIKSDDTRRPKSRSNDFVCVSPRGEHKNTVGQGKMETEDADDKAERTNRLTRSWGPLSSSRPPLFASATTLPLSWNSAIRASVARGPELQKGGGLARRLPKKSPPRLRRGKLRTRGPPYDGRRPNRKLVLLFN